MAGTCELCGKHVQFGHNVSFSKKRTNRTFYPNIQKTTVTVDGKSRSMAVCTSCIKTMSKTR